MKLTFKYKYFYWLNRCPKAVYNGIKTRLGSEIFKYIMTKQFGVYQFHGIEEAVT